MKQIFTLLILLTFSLSSSAQILAGYQLTEYTDINPDTVFNLYCGPGPSITENYFIDFNEDSQNDFQIKAYCSVSPGSSSRRLSIISLNPYWYSILGREDTIYNHKVAKPLYYGDSIDSPIALWDSTSLYLVYYFTTFGNTSSITDWLDTVDRYIGIKHQTVTDTIYGWIRVNCPNGNQCSIKDYSFGQSKQSNYDFVLDSIAVLAAKEPALSINDIELAGVSIYPNPASDIITVESNLLDEEVQLQLTDLLGKELKTGILTKSKATIDVSDVQEGIYFLILQTINATATKKIIVQSR